MKIARKEKGLKYLFGQDDFPSPIQIGLITEAEKNLHYHQKIYEYFLIARGKLIVEVNGIESIVKEGEVLCIEPQEKHLIKKYSSNLLCFLVKYPIDQKDKIIC